MDCMLCSLINCSVYVTETSATYVRWGKKVCPGNDTLVYSGK